ncbi:hypothetical protein V502_10127, partial [Pseudogymnoascus sp. VKM F-4520 (FW-2644)]
NRSFAMPPPRRKKLTQRDKELARERKKRQEKTRKRPPSLFRKAKILAADTDAWVHLTVLYASGQCDTFTSSDDPNWPNQDMRANYPLGKHEFLRKQISDTGLWKPVLEDGNDTDAGDRLISTVAPSPADNPLQIVNNTRRVETEEINAQVLKLEEANARLLELEKENAHLRELQQANEPHKNSLDASRESEEMIMEVIEESESPLHWSLENSCPGVGSDTEPDTASKTDKPNGTMIDTLLTDQMPEDMDKSYVACNVVATSEMDVDIQEVQNELQMDIAHKEAAYVLYNTSLQHSPQPSNDVPSWTPVNGLMQSQNSRLIDLQKLRSGWDWVFRKDGITSRAYQASIYFIWLADSSSRAITFIAATVAVLAVFPFFHVIVYVFLAKPLSCQSFVAYLCISLMLAILWYKPTQDGQHRSLSFAVVTSFDLFDALLFLFQRQIIRWRGALLPDIEQGHVGLSNNNGASMTPSGEGDEQTTPGTDKSPMLSVLPEVLQHQ